MYRVGTSFTVRATLVLSLVIANLTACDLTSSSRVGKVSETWETSNATFRIRVTSYAEEGGGFVPGAYYVFEASSFDSANWHEVMRLRHDDLVAIPRDQVRFVNDKVAYFFMVYKYAVTTDGAKTWLIRDIVRDLPNWEHHRPSIKDIVISADGSGKMELTSSTNQPAAPLMTKDYGRHWNAN